MRFMMLIIPKGYENAKAGAMPDAKMVESMMKYNKSLRDAGILVELEALHPPAMGARVTFTGGKPKVANGPFGTKETVGGYWIIRANSREEAVEWASRCPAAPGDIIEVRQMQEMEDFPKDVREAAAGFAEMQSTPKR